MYNSIPDLLVSRQFYNTLFSREKDGSIKPELAESYEYKNDKELDIILKRAEQYLPFLVEKDAYGTVSEKIKQLLTFRIPFYVGPLNSHSDKSWAVHTDKEGRILPWNFNERINKEKVQKNLLLV